MQIVIIQRVNNYINPNKQEMLDKPKKQSNIRIVVLKQAPHKKPLYQSFQINHQLCQRISSEKSEQKYRKYTNSVAFLSSVLQDENLANDERYNSNSSSLQSSNTYEVSKRTDREEQWPRIMLQSNKPQDRQLSCIIQSTEPQKNKYYRFKTESIDKIIAQKKMMPIDRLKIGSKNINFSTKNKEQLKKDFDQFVSISKLSPNNALAKNNQHIRSIIMSRKQGETNSKMKWRKRLKTEFKQEQTQPFQNQFHKGYKKGKEQVANALARYYKKVKTNMEEMENFRWSKVDQISYCLSK